MAIGIMTGIPYRYDEGRVWGVLSADAIVGVHPELLYELTWPLIFAEPTTRDVLAINRDRCWLNSSKMARPEKRPWYTQMLDDGGMSEHQDPLRFRSSRMLSLDEIEDEASRFGD